MPRENYIIPLSVKTQIAAQRAADQTATKADLEATAEALRLDVNGSGAGGNVTKEDLRAALARAAGAVEQGANATDTPTATGRGTAGPVARA